MKQPCPVCQHRTGSCWSTQRPDGIVRKYLCAGCGAKFFVQFAEDGTKATHKSCPPVDREAVHRLAGTTYVKPPSTLWVTPEVTSSEDR